MLVVVFVRVFYTKVVDTKGEGYFLAGVGEEADLCASTSRIFILEHP